MLTNLGANDRTAAFTRCALTKLSAAAAVYALVGCATPITGPDRVAAAAAATATATAQGSREEIYVLRTLREERNPKSTWCTAERAGFVPLVEDRFTIWAVQIPAGNGRISDAMASQAGTLRACFGATADPKVFNFYAEGLMSTLSMVGNGDCSIVRADSPEPGMTTFRCFLNLRGLPSAYAGGLLTTNTILSRTLLGDKSDPPGYVQASIATIRVWRAR